MLKINLAKKLFRTRNKSIIDMLLNAFDNEEYESSKCNKCDGIMSMTKQYFVKLPKYY